MVHRGLGSRCFLVQLPHFGFQSCGSSIQQACFLYRMDVVFAIWFRLLWSLRIRPNSLGDISRCVFWGDRIRNLGLLYYFNYCWQYLSQYWQCQYLQYLNYQYCFKEEQQMYLHHRKFRFMEFRFNMLDIGYL